MNIKLTIEYDGTDYHGWQAQTNGKTIQEVLEHALIRGDHNPPDASGIIDGLEGHHHLSGGQYFSLPDGARHPPGGA